MAQEVFEGHCQCGALSYRVTGVSATMFACHCTECQRQSGSAFGMALWVREPVLELFGGEPKEWIRVMPSGRQMSCQFCPDCGTRLFHQVLGQSQMLSIKPGTLRRPLDLKPVGHIWLSSKQKWLEIADGTLTYHENPETFDALMGAWAQSHSGQ